VTSLSISQRQFILISATAAAQRSACASPAQPRRSCKWLRRRATTQLFLFKRCVSDDAGQEQSVAAAACRRRLLCLSPRLERLRRSSLSKACSVRFGSPRRRIFFFTTSAARFQFFLPFLPPLFFPSLLTLRQVAPAALPLCLLPSLSIFFEKDTSRARGCA
jgi:hypothetical protein